MAKKHNIDCKKYKTGLYFSPLPEWTPMKFKVKHLKALEDVLTEERGGIKMNAITMTQKDLRILLNHRLWWKNEIAWHTFERVWASAEHYSRVSENDPKIRKMDKNKKFIISSFCRIMQLHFTLQKQLMLDKLFTEDKRNRVVYMIDNRIKNWNLNKVVEPYKEIPENPETESINLDSLLEKANLR